MTKPSGDQLVLAQLKVRTKTLSAANTELGRDLKKAHDQLARLVPLAEQACRQVSAGHDFRADLHLAIEDSKALLRDQGRTIH